MLALGSCPPRDRGGVRGKEWRARRFPRARERPDLQSQRERERRGQEKEQQAQPFLRAHVMKVAWASKHTLLSGHLGARISVISIDGEKEESFFCLVRDIG
jgi:hypothetical protein